MYVTRSWCTPSLGKTTFAEDEMVQKPFRPADPRKRATVMLVALARVRKCTGAVLHNLQTNDYAARSFAAVPQSESAVWPRYVRQNRVSAPTTQQK